MNLGTSRDPGQAFRANIVQIFIKNKIWLRKNADL